MYIILHLGKQSSGAGLCMCAVGVVVSMLALHPGPYMQAPSVHVLVTAQIQNHNGVPRQFGSCLKLMSWVNQPRGEVRLVVWKTRQVKHPGYYILGQVCALVSTTMYSRTLLWTECILLTHELHRTIHTLHGQYVIMNMYPYQGDLIII